MHVYCANTDKAEKIFENLRVSGVYHCGFEKEKIRIIKRLIFLQPQLYRFAHDPGRNAYEINGLVMEYCARFSLRIPRNTIRATRFSEAIKTYLQEQRLCNPDYIWLTVKGRYITILGIGEVKSHPNNAEIKPNQMRLQQINIKRLISANAIPHILSVSHRVAMSRDFKGCLILPRNPGKNYALPPYVPLGWQTREIEFTLPEIMFLKDQLLEQHATHPQNIPAACS